MEKKVEGWGLISFAILGIIFVLVYKNINNTLILIGPKSLAAFIICGSLILIGSKRLKNK